MTLVSKSMCESCGVGVKDVQHVPKGRYLWRCCQRCAGVLATEPSTPVFGLPLHDLPQPLSAYSGWWAYRIACDDLGYTLFHATSRAMRDALHSRWNAWLGGILQLQAERGTMLYRDTHEGNAFVEAWGRNHRPALVTPALAAWLLPRVVPDQSKSLLTATPSRATLEAAAGIPKRGALTHHEPR